MIPVKKSKETLSVPKVPTVIINDFDEDIEIVKVVDTKPKVKKLGNFVMLCDSSSDDEDIDVPRMFNSIEVMIFVKFLFFFIYFYNILKVFFENRQFYVLSFTA